MKKTKMKYRIINITKKSFFIRIALIVLAILALIFVINRNFFSIESDRRKMGFIICLFLLFLIFITIAQLYGSIKGKSKIIFDKRNLKKTNPYIYYRELPNTFGIGVNSLLLDSTLENEKDIVAVILDLCAKKIYPFKKRKKQIRN